MGCGIVNFVYGRRSARKAWRLEGYTPLDDLEKEYGVTCEYLFQAGLMAEKTIRRVSPPSYPYKISERGRLLMTEDEEYAIILIRPGCIEKVFLTCMAESIRDQNADDETAPVD